MYVGIDTTDLSWLSESVPQAALLTVQSKWTPIITSAFDNTQMIDSARYHINIIIIMNGPTNSFICTCTHVIINNYRL